MKTPKTTTPQFTATFTKKATGFSHTVLDAKGNVAATRNTKHGEPYLFAFIQTSAKGDVKVEYRQKNEAPAHFPATGVVIPIRDAAKIDQINPEQLKAEAVKPAKKVTAQEVLAVSLKKPNAAQISQQNKVRKINILKLNQAAKKAEATPEVPAGHHAGKHGTIFKDTTPEQIAAAQQQFFGGVMGILTGTATPATVLKKIDTALAKPVDAAHPATKDQLRILARDLDTGVLDLFKQWMDVNGVMGSDAVDLTDLVPVPKSTIKKDMVHLADLKKKLLVRTVMDQGTEWVHLTVLGEQLKTYLEEQANPAPLVVDGLTAHIETTTKAKPATPAKPAAQKRVPAPKFDRAAMRYAAIQETMVMVKLDSWTKNDYPQVIQNLEVSYPLLYSKLKTPEKVHAYSVGILDFCLAACRKLDTRP